MKRMVMLGLTLAFLAACSKGSFKRPGFKSKEATEQANGLLARVREEFEQARSQASSAREEARSHQLAAEQANALLGQVREELAQTRKQSSEAREEAARLRGQVEAIEGQRAELVISEAAVCAACR